MKTPAKYNKLLKENKITEEIIGEVLYSFNKRAKNFRDEKNKYRGSYNVYCNYEKNKEKEEEYYSKKEHLLKLFEPIELHKDTKIKNKRIRIYDYEMDYEYEESQIINKGSYWDNEIKEYVDFVDIIKTEKIDLYFLYYKVGLYDFHQPVEYTDIKKYNLRIKELNDFVTEGKDINDLLSVQFCNKVYERLMDNELEICTVGI